MKALNFKACSNGKACLNDLILGRRSIRVRWLKVCQREVIMAARQRASLDSAVLIGSSTLYCTA